MKKYSLFILSLLSSLLMFISCDKDDDTPRGGDYTPADFINTWVEFGTEGQYTSLTLANTHKVSGKEVYLNNGVLTSATISGTWMYYPSNNVLLIQTGRISADGYQQTHTTSYSIRELDHGRMTLVNQDTGSTETYYRLERQVTLSVGDKMDNVVPTGADCQSSDPDIISIEAGSTPVAAGSGTAFLLVSTESEAYVIECKVLHQSEIYTGYLGGSIEDVLAQYGEPDITGMIGENMAILYNMDPTTGIKALQVQFDATTLEVTRILIQYSDPAVWESDIRFISSWLNEEDDVYFPGVTELDSPFMIKGFESNGNYYISYNNLTYFLANGHFAPIEETAVFK